jgi:hypothetical protein
LSPLVDHIRTAVEGLVKLPRGHDRAVRPLDADDFGAIPVERASKGQRAPFRRTGRRARRPVHRLAPIDHEQRHENSRRRIVNVRRRNPTALTAPQRLILANFARRRNAHLLLTSVHVDAAMRMSGTRRPFDRASHAVAKSRLSQSTTGNVAQMACQSGRDTAAGARNYAGQVCLSTALALADAPWTGFQAARTLDRKS